MSRYDAVVVGGGHNGLAAAAYLARAGWSVLVLERSDHVGGAAVSARPFPGVDVRLSRFAYLVSLLPGVVVEELGLDVRLARRRVASYTPPGLLIPQDGGREAVAAFAGDGEGDAWAAWEALTARWAAAVWPTLTEPLVPRAEIERRVGDRDAWAAIAEAPIGEALEACFADDTVRGLVLTDALIGVAASAHEPDLRQNRCLLYHAVGGPWRVPVGGMGAVSGALLEACVRFGADVRCSSEVSSIAEGEVVLADGSVVGARHVVAAVAPAVLDRLRGVPTRVTPAGSQVKVNLVLDRLPALRDGTDPADGFAGTFHAGEGYAALEAALAGPVSHPPVELYCHTLTDPSILGPGSTHRHTLTLFGLHHHPGDGDPLATLQEHLAEPLEDCVTRDADGRPCIEVATPADVERELAMPGGHIFHGDLQWPWAETSAEVGTWGVETDDPSIVLCGAGARRGGGVSAIPGRAAAMALLRGRVADRPR